MFSWKGKKISELGGKKISKVAPAYLILGLAVIAMTFFGVCDPSGNRLTGPSGVAASVNGEDITALQFRRAHIQRIQQAQQQYKDGFDAAKLGISQSVVNGLVDQEIYYQEALQNGIAASQEEVENIIIEGKYFQDDKGKFDAKLFNSYLKRQGHSEASFSEELARSIVNNKLRNFLTSTYRTSGESDKIDKILSETKINIEFLSIEPATMNVSVTDEQVAEFLKTGGEEKVKSYYTRNSQDYNRPQTVHARHVLIAYKEAARATGEGLKRDKAQAQELANKVLAEAKAKPADFEAIVKKYTDEPSGKVKGGDLGFIKEGDMVAPFSEAAFALDAGQISNVVETQFGFHIIKVEEKRAPLAVSLDEAKPEIAKKLASQDKRPELAKAAAEKVLAGVKSGNEAVLAENGLAWKETGEFALNARFIPGGLGADATIRQAAIGLSKPAQVADNFIEANGNFYILRLKNRKDADLNNLVADEKDPLAGSQAFEAFWTYSKLMNDVKKKYEDSGKVYKNEDFVQYDAIQSSQAGS